MAKGINRSESEMFPLMAAYSARGHTQAAFCEAEGLKLATFQYGGRRYRASQAKSAGFVALEPEPDSKTRPSAARPSVEVRVGEVEVRVWGVGAAYVAEVVAQLAGRC